MTESDWPSRAMRSIVASISFAPESHANFPTVTGTITPVVLVQIMETFREDDSPEQNDSSPAKPDLITHVAVDKLTMHDKDALEPALDDTGQRGLKPAELLVDSLYGSTECLEKGNKRNVKIISPAMTPKGKLQGRLTLEDFELDDDGRVLHCPEDCVPLSTTIAESKLQVLFDKADCESCPDRNRCPTSAVGRSSSRYQYTHDRVRQRIRRLQDCTPEFRNRYRWRAGVEATMSRFKYQMGMARLRVRGRARVTYTAMLRGLGLNIHRVATWRMAIRNDKVWRFGI